MNSSSSIKDVTHHEIFNVGFYGCGFAGSGIDTYDRLSILIRVQILDLDINILDIRHICLCLFCKCHAYNQESIVNNDEEILRLQRERERENTTENKH